MSIKDLKFDTSDFSGKDISSLPDRPGDSGITGQQLKERFDLIPKMVVALGGFNNLIDELGKTTSGASGASNIGVSSISGVSGSNVQTVLGSLGTMAKNAKTAADTAAAQGTAAESAALRATEAAENAAEKATAAENATGAAVAAANEASQAAAAATAAITEVKDYAAEQAQSAKDYVDNVILEGGAVTSVFGRAGEVKAQAGDYTADMVGAAPAGFGLGSKAKLISNTDLLDSLAKSESGWYCGTNVTNAPVSGWCYFEIIAESKDYSVVLAYPMAGGAYRNLYEKGALAVSTWARIYDEGYKPTAANVDAVSKSGDTMSGDLSVSKKSPRLELNNTNTNSNVRVVDVGDRAVTQIMDSNGDYRQFRVRSIKQESNIANAIDWYDSRNTNVAYKIYGEHNKPTAADVGAPTLESNGRINGAQACSSVAYVTVAARTLTQDDIGKTIVCYNSTNKTITIPAGLPVGTEFEIVRYGVGTVTIAGAEGVILNSVESARTIKNQYGVVSLKRIFADYDSWLLVGDLG